MDLETFESAPKAVCPVHGTFDCGHLFGGGFQGGTFIGNKTGCPVCGRTSRIIDGKYTFVNSVVGAFRRPDVTREKIERLRDVATSVQAGVLTSAEADRSVEDLGASLISVWKWANDNAGALGVLLAIIALYLSIHSAWSSDTDGEKQAEAMQRQTEVIEMIYTELQKERSAAPPPVRENPPQQSRAPSMVPQTIGRPSHLNRHDRRKAARLQIRHPKPDA